MRYFQRECDTTCLQVTIPEQDDVKGKHHPAPGFFVAMFLRKAAHSFAHIALSVSAIPEKKADRP
ncbi:hypothetical protein [Asticcacaulis excentricus]|uniref:hypothetical protein n=1 Tax=Asticcacaulis excentricus TaxID=78587 RepID=UPI0005A10197|nr:hypothetical protein [Asticcacaulis excentricus]